MSKKSICELIPSLHIIISNLTMCFIILLLDRYSSTDTATDIGIVLALVYIASHFFINIMLNSKHNLNKDKVFTLKVFSLLISSALTVLIIRNTEPVSRSEICLGLTYVGYWLLITASDAVILAVSILCIGIRKYKEFKALGIAIILLLAFLILSILWI